MSLTFLLGLLSAVCTVVVFRHLATKSSFYFACFYLLFSRPWLLPSRCYCFSYLGCRAVLRFSTPFLILAAIFLPCHFHHCHPFYRCSASNIAAFHSRLDLELPFFARSVVAIFILLLRTFCCDYRSPPHFLSFLFWLSFFSSFSCRHPVPIVTAQPLAIHIL